ncbi:DUF883 family protein [Cupriavidus oxalaticus]|uniref:DUF883 family protein n=1 Tax=Cupriavidus oxalaticus TaxID=96344 RepID=A0A4P7LSH2_9BURK|nr:DUF883 family protein [Cupriavidus oxalaticus]
MSNSGGALREIDSLMVPPTTAAGEPAASPGKIEERLKKAKKKVADVQYVVVEKSRHTARVADDYVHERPWTAIGVAAAVGVLIGWLIDRR